MSMVYDFSERCFRDRREYMDERGIHPGEFADDPDPDEEDEQMGICVLCGNKNEGEVTFAIVTNTPYPVPCCTDVAACRRRQADTNHVQEAV